jgi:hypothetical protein
MQCPVREAGFDSDGPLKIPKEPRCDLSVAGTRVNKYLA